jgi:hypothetical protein
VESTAEGTVEGTAEGTADLTVETHARRARHRRRTAVAGTARRRPPPLQRCPPATQATRAPSTRTTNWLCKPGIADDVCSRDLDATAVAGDIGGDLTPEWGMHLVDANIEMGDIEDLVAAQAEAYVR